MSINAAKASIHERFLAVDTAIVIDVLDRPGLPDEGLAPEFTAVSGTLLVGWPTSSRDRPGPTKLRAKNAR